MHLDVYLLLKFVHMNVIFILYFFRETFISDRVTLLSYYLDFRLVSMETNKKQTKKHAYFYDYYHY